MSRTLGSLPTLGALAALALAGGGAATALAQHDGAGAGAAPPATGTVVYAPLPGRTFSLDRLWLRRIAQADRSEIATGTLATQKGTNTAVKSLATRLVTDHRAHLARVRSVARRLGVAVPTTPGAVQQLAGQVLARESGTLFDQDWAAYQVGAHVDAIDETQAEIAGGRYAPAVALARATLPVLRVHLGLAQAVARTVGPPTTTTPTTTTTTPTTTTPTTTTTTPTTTTPTTTTPTTTTTP